MLRTVLVKRTDGVHWSGHLRVYLFGLLVADIQLTKPWE